MTNFAAIRRWVLLVVAVAAPARAAVDERPNVLLIVSEDNGPELGCYGDPHAQTPHLDRLAHEGVRFENAFVPYSVCSPSRACFLTGLYPHQNGQIGLATHKFAMYRQDTPNFASILRAAGYRTGMIGKLHVNPESAFPFDYRAIEGANFNRKIALAEYAAQAGRFFADAKGRPWFLSVNFPDAHLPFVRQVDGLPAEPLAAGDVEPMPWVGVDSPRLRKQVANYYNCLARLDHGVGALLAELDQSGQAERTMVIYIGDHGAQFPRGKGTVYEAALRVPMIVRYPAGAIAGQVRRELVSTIDLLPTALAAAGVAPPANLPGRDLGPQLAGEPARGERRYIFGFTTGAFPRACYVQHSIRDERYKLIFSPRPDTENLEAGTYLDPAHQHFVVTGARADEQATAPPHVRAAWARWRRPPRYELYDLTADPHEWHDLAADPAHTEVKERLTRALAAWQHETGDPFVERAAVDAFVAEQLSNRDLGYRTREGFRWSYLDAFVKWRAQR